MTRPRAQVALTRLLSKLGVASRAQAPALIRAGRVRVDGCLITDVTALVRGSAVIAVDRIRVKRPERRVVAFHKPRGTITSRRDPEGRPTIFDVLGEAGHGLIAVGRLDRASTGLLLLTTDTSLAAALTDPARAVLRQYVVTVRGRVTPEVAARLTTGLDVPAGPGRSERLRAKNVVIRKASGRETHLLVDLDEGRNREIRRLFDAVGHEVTRLHRTAFGRISLGDLQPGAWRDVSADDITATLGRVAAATARPPATTHRPRQPRARSGGSDSAA